MYNERIYMLPIDRTKVWLDKRVKITQNGVFWPILRGFQPITIDLAIGNT